MQSRTKKPTAIDLFSGGGGLSLGLKEAGFEVVAGVEIDPKIAQTYKANHKNAKLFVKDLREVKGKKILETLGLETVDLIAGCPPCQGFSSLTRKYRRSDSRDDLALEMARIIKEIRPRMVMMENVPGLAGKGNPILREFVEILKKLNYKVKYEILQLADYGVPQSRRRLVLLAGRGFEVEFPKQTHSRNGNEKKGLKPWMTLGDVIKETPPPVTLSKALRENGPQKFNWHVIRDLKEISIKRLKSLKSGNDRKLLPKNLRPKCHANGNRGFTNVYGRMSWAQLPPTITSGCTTLAMGRFGHPDETRTISVREAALIQTFPKKYRIDTDFMYVACEVIGNAFPPKIAKIAARQCIKAAKRHGGFL